MTRLAWWGWLLLACVVGSCADREESHNAVREELVTELAAVRDSLRFERAETHFWKSAWALTLPGRPNNPRSSARDRAIMKSHVLVSP